MTRNLLTKKIKLANLPTPIQKMETVSKRLGKNIFLKRDDFTGMEVSGNKIRKLEYTLFDAIEQDCDTVITTGAIQSNHCRATAFACARLGLSCILVLRSAEGVAIEDFEGNTFFDLVSGAKVYLIDEDVEALAFMESLKDSLAQEGKKAYLIPVGASNAVGSLGYRECFLEILEQEKALNLEFDAIVLAVGSGGTYAGLYFENQKQKAKKDIWGFSVSKKEDEFVQVIQDILANMAGPNNEEDIKGGQIIINDLYIGEGYAKTTREEIFFLLDIAAESAVIFDPCYTGKAFRGLCSEIEKGSFDKYENILFIHTGGLFGWTKDQRKLAMASLKQQLV